MELLYFAQIRENIGHGSESMTLPENIADVGCLINHLRRQGDNYKAAFHNDDIICVAINQNYVKFDHPIKNDDEIAFFPPMTGG